MSTQPPDRSQPPVSLQDFFSRLPRPLRIGLPLLLLASTGLTLALPLEFQPSVMSYLSALAQDWPLLVSGAMAWAFLIIARWRKWGWRWVATPAIIHGLIAYGKGMLRLSEIASGVHTAWGNATIVALIFAGLGLMLLGLGAWQPLFDRLRAKALKRLRPEQEEAPPPKGGWTDTEILKVTDDQFGFRDYAGVLADRAATAGTPLTIGIFGRWGSGKTSLMRLVEAALPKETEKGDQLRSIWINVWQLSNQDEVWSAFLQALFTQVHRELRWYRRLKFDWDLFRERVRWRILIWTLIVNSYRIVVTATPILLAKLWPDKTVTDANELLAFALNPLTRGGASLILALWLLARPAVEAAREKVSLDLGAVLKEAPYEAQVSALQRLQSQFERMVEAGVGKNGRLVVFIDDLDRCMPDKVPEVLEALKLFTTTHGCVYVLGLDHDVVRQGVATKYKFSQDEGAEYLEKIVQIPFHLPPLEDDRIEAFVRKIYPGVYKDCPNASKVFSLGLEPNPRKVKRALNIYRTLLDVTEVRWAGWVVESLDPELVAKMVVIQSRFRALYDELVRHPELIIRLEEWAQEFNRPEKVNQTGQEQATAEELRALLELEKMVPELGRPALAAMLALEKGAHFRKLGPDELSTYIYLAGTAEGGARLVRPSREERNALLGGDPYEIKRQVGEILARSQEDAARQQEIRQTYVDRLWGVVNEPEVFQRSEQLSAVEALKLMGEVDERSVVVPAGLFLMGSTDEQVKQVIADGLREDWAKIEQPQHMVELGTYRIGRYPVTNAEYQAFVRDTGHRSPDYWGGEEYPEGKGDHPVVNVSWHDALAYCQWLSEKTGRAYRLPTEAEWEKAARGTDGRVYPWGNEWDETKLNSAEGGPDDTTPVGQYSPGGDSPYGAADMAGNVWEWTQSVYKDYPYDPQDGREDLEAEGRRVVRGGAFRYYRWLVRCAYRYGGNPDLFHGDYGFRVCVAPG